jgi:hypothetical protein
MGGHTLARHVGKTDAERFFAGYLHEDFAQEYGTPEEALRAFEADASDAECRRLRAEAKRLRARGDSMGFAELRALLSQLGARWAPRSRPALMTFLESAAAGKREAR